MEHPPNWWTPLCRWSCSASLCKAPLRTPRRCTNRISVVLVTCTNSSLMEVELPQCRLQRHHSRSTPSKASASTILLITACSASASTRRRPAALSPASPAPMHSPRHTGQFLSQGKLNHILANAAPIAAFSRANSARPPRFFATAAAAASRLGHLPHGSTLTF